MKNILTHIGVAAIAVVATLLFMRGCGKTEVIRQTETIVECTVDTITQVETHTIVKYKTKVDTVERIVYQNIEPEYPEELLTYEEHYKDSTYSVYGNIAYSGTINRHEQMFVHNKETIEFIPKITTEYVTKTEYITKESRKPRLLLGMYSTLNIPDIQQLGFNITLVDNKYRMYTVGKDVLNKQAWSVEFKAPVIWTSKQ